MNTRTNCSNLGDASAQKQTYEDQNVNIHKISVLINRRGSFRHQYFTLPCISVIGNKAEEYQIVTTLEIIICVHKQTNEHKNVISRDICS